MKNKKVDALKIMLSIFFAIVVIYPLFHMLMYVKNINIWEIWTSPQCVNAIKNSIILSFVATIISLCLAFSLAWCLERSNVKYKNIIKIILTLPMLIPSISHGMGLIILFGANGLITNLLNLQWNIYGAPGIVIGSVMYSFPVAFLMFVDVLKYEDGNPYQAAEILGIPVWSQFLKITGSYMRKPMISIVFATFTLIITDYGVPLLVGGKCTTLPVVMYQDVIGLLDFGKGSAIGIILLVPAVFAFIIDILNDEKGRNNNTRIPYQIRQNKVRDSFSQVYCIMMAIIVMMPILTFALLAFVKKYPIDMSLTTQHVLKTFEMSGGKYLLNSIVIALTVASIGVVLAFFVAYLATRLKSKVSYVLHLVSIVSLAIPGIVLGLSYAMTFKKWPIYGTFIIVIMVNLAHFFSSPYLMMYNTLGKINENIEAIGKTLGIRRLYVIKDIIIPQVKYTAAEMFSYFFVNCMMTISAISFLVTIQTKTISLMITQFEAQMLIECSAFVSLVILLVNLFMKYIVSLIQRRYKRNELQ